MLGLFIKELRFLEYRTNNCTIHNTYVTRESTFETVGLNYERKYL